MPGPCAWSPKSTWFRLIETHLSQSIQSHHLVLQEAIVFSSLSQGGMRKERGNWQNPVQTISCALCLIPSSSSAFSARARERRPDVCSGTDQKPMFRLVSLPEPDSVPRLNTTLLYLISLESWCNDDPACVNYTENSCNEDWLKVNCPRQCGICGNGKQSS